jgi:hypothetical protein
MDESKKWGQSRFVALLIVLALHVSVMIALIIVAKTRILVTSTRNPVELLVLPRNSPTQIPVPPPAAASRSRKAAPATLPPSSAITIDPSAAAADRVAAPVDWALEAQSVAAGIAKKDSAGRSREAVSSPPSPFAAPPPHHKGEQIPTADGQWIVYVSDDCYQVSKSITSITNATNNGMSLQTYCTRHSKKPRGDLFEQLPEYKKLHPDN